MSRKTCKLSSDFIMSKKWDFREVCHFSIAKGYFFIKYSTVAARQKYWKPKECVSQTSCSAYMVTLRVRFYEI